MSSFATDVPVVVVYRGGHGALSIGRSLARMGIPVYLVSQKVASPVAGSRYWQKRFWWDFAAEEEASVQFLLDVARQIGGRPVLLTLADWVAIFIESHSAALESGFVFPRAAQPVVSQLSNKWQLFQFAKEHGIPTPQTAFPQSRQDVQEFLNAAQFPIMIKDADAFLIKRKSNEIVANGTELLDRYDRAAENGPANLIFQEFIPGDAQDVWMCNAYFDRNSQCRAVFTGKKLRQLSDTGLASLAVCLPNEVVARQTRDLMQGVGYRGACGIGYRYDARDGEYKILDVNPRVSGVFRLFRATNGMDIARICYLDLTGQPVPESKPSYGRKWLLEDDFFSAIESMRDHKLTLRQWLSSLRGINEAHWFSLSDPVPFIIWLRQQLMGRIRSGLRRTPLRRVARAFRRQASRA